MNILVIGEFYIEAFAQHIAETFVDMGHHVSRIEINTRRYKKLTDTNWYLNKISTVVREIYIKTPAYEKKLSDRIKNNLKSEKHDLVLVCHDYLTRMHLNVIREYSQAPVCLWFPDSISNFGKAMFINAGFDFYFFKDPYIVRIVQSDIGLSSVYYLPECCNPVYHKKVELSDEERLTYGCDIATAGNLHAMRVQFFKQLKEYDVKIWGNRAPHWMNIEDISTMVMNHYVANVEKSKAFGGAKILINNLYPSEVYGVNVRAFEIAAVGGFQLINYRPGIRQLFEEESEIVTFNNINDLKKKIDKYIHDDVLRLNIGENSRNRALKDHTYKVRLQLMLDTVFNKKKGFELLLKYE